MFARRGSTALALSGVIALALAACSAPSPEPVPYAGDTTPPAMSTQPSHSVGATESPTAAAQPSAEPSAEPTATAPTPSAQPLVSADGKTAAKDTSKDSPKSTSKANPKETPKSVTASGRWKPKAGLTWQWQLSGKLDTSVKAQVYDVDLFDTSAAQVKALQAKGIKVICYFSAGSYEKGRPDSGDFPASVKGKTMDGWPENWLDIRSAEVLKIMGKRMDLCASKGFDGVEPDNVDGYQNNSGFSLTAADQLAYNKALAKLAHDRGLAIGLKNDLDQVSTLVSSFDFAINEECYAWDECGMLKPFISAGKPVFHVEYDVATSTFCPTTTKLGFSSMKKNLSLNASRTYCP